MDIDIIKQERRKIGGGKWEGGGGEETIDLK